MKRTLCLALVFMFVFSMVFVGSFADDLFDGDPGTEEVGDPPPPGYRRK